MPHEVARIPVYRRSLAALATSLLSLPAIRSAHAAGHPAFESQLSSALAGARPAEVMALRGSLARLARTEIPVDGKLVLVNIAARTLAAYRNGIPELEMRVVCGRPSTPTPVRADRVEEILFNPTWTPPPSILREPIWRARAADSSYLRAYGFSRTSSGGLIQAPGPRNVLGMVKFRLAAGGAIFMHDTNERASVTGEDRLLSHGCVRLERPLELAAWMMNADVSQSVATRISGQRAGVVPPEPVPVALAYFTAWPDASGQLRFHPDRYGLDGGGRAVRPVSRRRQENDADPEPSW